MGQGGGRAGGLDRQVVDRPRRRGGRQGKTGEGAQLPHLEP